MTPIEGRSVGHPATLAAALLASLVVALAVRPATADEGAAGSTPAEATADPTIWPSPEWPLARNEAHERRIDGLLGEMTIEEKVGQILQGDISTLTPDDVRDYHLGAVLSGGNSGPYGDDKAPPARWLELADELISVAPEFAEGWNKRAEAFFMLDRYGAAMADIEQVLILEPRHFGAWAGLGLLMEAMDLDQGALRAFRRATEIYPAEKNVAGAIERLELQTGGRTL